MITQVRLAWGKGWEASILKLLNLSLVTHLQGVLESPYQSVELVHPNDLPN